jgi:hypothetical protein
MPTTANSAKQSDTSEPHLPSGSINLPVPASTLLPATTDQSLTEKLIRLLAASYVRREGRFYHIDRPTEPLAREDLQRVFLFQAAAINGGQDAPNAVMKQVYNTAITQMNSNQYRSIPVWTSSAAL